MDTPKNYKLFRNLIIISFFAEIVLFCADSLGLYFLMEKSYVFWGCLALIPTPSVLLLIFAVICAKYFSNVKKSMTENKKLKSLYVFSLLMFFYHIVVGLATKLVATIAYISKF